MTGTLATEGIANIQASATVGSVLTGQSFGATESTALEFDVPAASAGALILAPDTTDSWSAARYDTVKVFSRATLTITSGTYFVDRLTIEPQGQILVDDSNGPVVIVVGKSMVARGEWQDGSNNGQALDLVIASDGVQTISLETAFDGFVVAPAATVRLTGNEVVHSGAFFAKNLLVTPGVHVDHRSMDVCSLVGGTSCGDCPCLTPGSYFESFVLGSAQVSPGNVSCSLSQSTAVISAGSGFVAGGEGSQTGSGFYACQGEGTPQDTSLLFAITQDQAQFCADILRDALIDYGVAPNTCSPW